MICWNVRRKEKKEKKRKENREGRKEGREGGGAVSKSHLKPLVDR